MAEDPWQKGKERRVRTLQDCTAVQPSSQRMGQDFWEGLWDISGCLLSGIQWGNSRNAWEHVNLVQYALKTQILWVLPRLQNPQEAYSSVDRNPFKEEAYVFCLGQSASWLLPLGYIWVYSCFLFLHKELSLRVALRQARRGLVKSHCLLLTFFVVMEQHQRHFNMWWHWKVICSFPILHLSNNMCLLFIYLSIYNSLLNDHTKG